MAKVRPYPYHVLDVFTTTRFAGNPLAVVLNADDMSDEAMQKIAREFNLSETIFVMAPAMNEHEARVRIFTPQYEMPFAGHPTVGCAVFLAERHWPKGSVDEVLVLEEEAGLVPVRVVRDNKTMRATFTAPVIPFPVGDELDRNAVAATLGLDVSELGDHPAQTHEGGPSFTYVHLRDVAALEKARVTEPHWSAVHVDAQRDSTFLYAPDGEGRYRTRMFAPGSGIGEDPATGSASAILASQLLQVDALDDGTTELQLIQGVEMGRRSEIDLAIDVTNGAIGAVRVSGSAVRVADGQVLA